MATSLIPDGSGKAYKLSKKVVDRLSHIVSNNGGDTYAEKVADSKYGVLDQIANDIDYTSGYDPVGHFALATSIVSNQSAIPITTPRPIEYVDRDLIASNHHSVYAYNGLTYAGTGKVATGSSVESKVVEDVVLTYDEYPLYYDGDVSLGDKITLAYGSKQGWQITITREGGFLASVFESMALTGNILYYGGTAYAILDRVIACPTPTHSTLALDAASIVGVKGLVTQTSEATQVFTQEVSSGWDGTSTFVDGVTTGLVIGTTYEETTSKLLYVAESGTITVSDTNTWSCPASYNDTATFKQLTSGATTDSGANSIQTKVLLKPSSVRI